MKTNYPEYIFGSTELGLLKLINDGNKGKIKLIYLDPPHFTGSDFSYTENNEKVKSKTIPDFKKIFEISKELLTEDGFLILHSNYRYSSPILIQVFDVFGINNFINEIIWVVDKKIYKNQKLNRIFRLPNAHDNIYIFSKTDKFKINNFKEEQDSQFLNDIWTDIPSMDIMIKESGNLYNFRPTQLHQRILNFFSNEDDIVVDLFTGSGSFLISAEFLNRKAIGIGNSLDSFIITTKRLEQKGIALIYTKIEEIVEVKRENIPEMRRYKILDVDKRSFNITSPVKIKSDTEIKEELEKSPIEKINKALEIPVDLLKKISFIIALAFPCYLLMNLISTNFFWLLTSFALFTAIWLLFAKYALKQTVGRSLFDWKPLIFIIALNLILAFGANQIIKHKELIKSFKEIIK